ncbi:MAG: AI-2E family transporter [Anaerolineales bacterium]|uniref:AI-2E family transporter n=1 Tax=Candidatus Villigracilis vicinus TaxID=3140679 RepID=UPI003134DA83|nr:AI-2E family transporter [Anaerolineales bacterium]MBK7451983.1 AI-2E family transporter [Anaerolineales bacterium]MBK9781291.1 AI-2E family transporter [Anaerolineales bacterium]
MEQTPKLSSPGWGTNTKLVVALTVVVVVGALLVKFQFIITPLVMAFLLSYLFHPLADLLQRKLRISWNASVAVIFLIIIILLLGLLTLGGVGLVQQVQSLVVILQDALRTLPQLIEDISGRVIQFGPFKFDFSALDLNDLSQQVLGMVQPLLSRTGTLVGTVAGSAANFLGWTLFVILVSYFTLVESRGLRNQIITVDVPGYNQDLARLSRDLGRIWNAFLRGQIIIFVLAVIVYSIVLSVLGVHYAISLAFLAGLARFVPYVGPAINWAILVIVAYFQDYSIFHLPDLTYTLIVLVIALLIDQVFDNIVSPRILSNALKVHPAAVLVAAIIAANLFGILGVVVAAPILATATLLWNYVMRKMLDLDPFPEKEVTQPPPPPGSRWMVAIRRFFRDRKLKAKK